jgi:hypothetical protein
MPILLARGRNNRPYPDKPDSPIGFQHREMKLACPPFQEGPKNSNDWSKYGC